MSTYELMLQYQEARETLNLGWIIFGGVIAMLGLAAFIGGASRKSLVPVGVVMSLGGLMFAAGANAKPAYVDAPDVAKSALGIVQDEIQMRYKVKGANIEDENSSSRWMSQLAYGGWEDRPHVVVLTEDYRALEYEVGFNDSKELVLYAVSDTQQVDPETLKR